ncbi:MAG: hypothetical protein JJU37_00435 [Balneolaceae bacterium]|nr:hypothetical protein [Balneolaceae bacterium]
MKNRYTFWFILPLLFFAFLSIKACSDDSTSADPGEPPSLPATMAPVMIDMQYFQDQSVSDSEEHSGYKSVESMVTLGSAMFNAEGTMNLVNSFLSLAPMLNVNPEWIDGSWVWEFNVTGFFKETDDVNQTTPNQTIISIIATPSGSGFEWQVVYTGMFGETGLDNFSLITGFTSAGYSTGEWRFFSPDSNSEPIAVYSWEVISPTEKTALLTIRSFGEFNDIVISYNMNGADNYLNFEPSNGNYQRAYWNTETNSGWYEDFQTSRICYTNFVNSECS